MLTSILMIFWKVPWTLLAIFSSVPGAYLSFRRSFIRDLKDQMVNWGNPGGVGTKTVSLPYRILAYVFLGKQDKWLTLFDPMSKLNRSKATPDKGDAFRIFVWFVVTFAFLFLAWFTRCQSHC